jgi:hypothetical protein
MAGWIMREHGVPDSRLTVSKQAEDYIEPKRNKRHAQWLCFCDCGNPQPVVVLDYRLKNGLTLSCGCFHKEVLVENNKRLKKKRNKYDISGKYGIGWTINTNKEFYFDIEDYHLIENYCWYESTTNNGKYHSLRSREENTNKTIVMAWLIKGKHYDHKDRNPLNNRKSNLRKATMAQNSQNSSIRSSNSSNVIGVNFEADRNKWRAQLRKEGERKLDMRFENKEDAIKARLQAEAEYFGEFAPQKHLFEKYNIVFEPKEGADNV